MGNKNTNLQVAKRAKDDEFYTTYETVEQEVLHYVDQFKNKINWKDTVINVLEGGREALDLREVTYGDKD